MPNYSVLNTCSDVDSTLCSRLERRPMDDLKLSGWALILGASSGFGEATALELARRGMDIFGVHLDRRATMPNVERIVSEIRAAGRKAEFFNINAADEEK